jgi:hypothetical protein
MTSTDSKQQRRHRLSGHDSVVGESDQCGSIVCNYDPAFIRRTGQDQAIVRAFQTDVLNSYDIELRLLVKKCLKESTVHALVQKIREHVTLLGVPPFAL